MFTREARDRGRQIVFQAIGDLFTYYVMPPAVTAALYRAIALIPGVRVHRNAVDLAGQHGTGFVLYTDSIANDIILSPHSYRFMGVQYSQPHTPPDGVAIVSRAFVSGPGVRP